MFSRESLIRLFLFEIDTSNFVFALLATVFAHQVLSKSQTIRPFFPLDGTLWHEHNHDSIHTATLFIIYDFIIAPLIFLLERFRLSKLNIHSSTRTKLALRLAFGMWTSTMIALVFIEFGKGYVGALRPSFARACLDSSSFPPPINDPQFQQPIFSNSQCHQPNLHIIHDKRRSFPSGHAALAVGGAAYAQLYIIYAMRRWKGPEIIAYILNLVSWLFMTFGSWVAASRIVDNAHHASDVAVGCIIGLWTAAVHFWFLTGRNSIIEDDPAVQSTPQNIQMSSSVSSSDTAVTKDVKNN